jgi:large subunit ribosomal protein L21e
MLTRQQHVRHSRSREEFILRVKENSRRKKEAKAKGETVDVKRQPAKPKEARTISLKGNWPENIAPAPYETTI